MKQIFSCCTGLSSADEEVQLQAVKAAKLLLMEDRDDSSIQSDVEILVLAVVPKLLDFLGYSDKYKLITYKSCTCIKYFILSVCIDMNYVWHRSRSYEKLPGTRLRKELL